MRTGNFEQKNAGMTLLTMRQRLMDYMKVADAKKLEAIYTLLESDITQKKGFSIEQYNKELEMAEKQIESGNYIPQEELEKEMKKW